MAADPDWDMYGDIDWDIDSDDINETPTCILCGVMVRGMIHSQPANPTTSAVLFREDKWKHYRKAKLEHVMVPSKEVEERDFKKFPSMWSCMCRASEYHKSILGPVHPNGHSNQRACYPVLFEWYHCNGK